MSIESGGEGIWPEQPSEQLGRSKPQYVQGDLIASGEDLLKLELRACQGGCTMVVAAKAECGAIVINPVDDRIINSTNPRELARKIADDNGYSVAKGFCGYRHANGAAERDGRCYLKLPQ